LHPYQNFLDPLLNNVIYFSPDGRFLAYAKFNDTDCGHIEFIRFDGNKYPTLVDVSYPKVFIE